MELIAPCIVAAAPGEGPDPDPPDPPDSPVSAAASVAQRINTRILIFTSAVCRRPFRPPFTFSLAFNR